MKAFPESSSPSNGIMVSVLAIAYNHELWIAHALDSFVMQKTIFPIEILVHDDASTDKTAEIIKEYEKKYPGLVKGFYQTENQFSQGNNPLFILSQMARGKYVAICECDDYWTDPFKLEKQVDLLEAHPECSMAVAKTDIYYLEDGQFYFQQTLEGVNKDLLYFNDLFNGCPLHISTHVIPKNIFNFVVEKYRHKIFLSETALRYILVDIGPFVFLRETVSVYRITGKGIWTMLDRYAQVAAETKTFEELYAHFDPKYNKYWGNILVPLYMHIIFLDIRERRLDNIARNGIRLVYLGLRHPPLNVLMLNRIYIRGLRFIQRKMKEYQTKLFSL